LHLVRLVGAAHRKDQHAAVVQTVTQFSKDVLLFGQGHVPDAVPARDEVVPAGQIPATNVRVVKSQPGMTLSSQCDHSLRNVNAFYMKSLLAQKVDEAAVAPASHIQRLTWGSQEPDGPLELRQAAQYMLWRFPTARDRVITASDIGGRH
jgi:hypothetical protein